MARRRRRDPYRLLGIRRSASRDDVSRAYVRRNARLPDHARRRDLDTAYRVLWRPVTRARYDRLHRAAVRRLARTSALGIGVVVLLTLAAGSGLWYASRDAGRGPAGAAAAGRQPPRPAAAAATLRAEDLPAGYHLLSQGPVQFGRAAAGQPATGGSVIGPPVGGPSVSRSPAGGGEPAAGPAPPSWDVVFAADSPGAAQRRLVESLAVAYPAPEEALQALDRAASGGGTGAAAPVTALSPPSALGLDAREWVERAAGGGRFAVTHIAWVWGSLVMEVSLLDLAGPAGTRQAASLAVRQQRHL